MTFSEQNRELGEIIRELEIVCNQNLELAQIPGGEVPW